MLGVCIYTVITAPLINTAQLCLILMARGMIKMDCFVTLEAESRDPSDVKQRNEVVLMLSSEFDNQNPVLQVVQANPLHQFSDNAG